MIRGENLKDAGDKSDYEKKRKPISVCVGVAVCVYVDGCALNRHDLILKSVLNIKRAKISTLSMELTRESFGLKLNHVNCMAKSLDGEDCLASIFARIIHLICKM